LNSCLVTGASGMLGRHLVNHLLAQKAQVRVLVRPSSDITFSEGQTVEIVTGETTDSKAIADAMVGIDIVFHVAAYLTVNAPFGADGDDPAQWEIYKRVNVDFTAALLDAARRAKAGRFVYVSSNSVYDLNAPVPTTEDAPLNPGSLYGRSKKMAEALVQAAQQQGLSTTIIRPAVIYGPGDRYFTPAALQLAKLPVLPLVNGGKTLFDMVYVADVVELLWLASQSERADGRIYNAGPGQKTSIKAMVDAYRQLTGKGPRLLTISARTAARFAPVSRRFLSQLAPGTEAAMTPPGLQLMSQDLHLDMSRAERELRFRPRFSLVEGLAATLYDFNNVIHYEKAGGR
jgi:nucleoside-diphosphate-sugar epimerase